MRALPGMRAPDVVRAQLEKMARENEFLRGLLRKVAEDATAGGPISPWIASVQAILHANKEGKL